MPPVVRHRSPKLTTTQVESLKWAAHIILWAVALVVLAVG
jgi:hypothetical protein